MIVKCIKIVSPITLKVIDSHPSISLGASYRVFGIDISTNGKARFRIVGEESGTPALWDSEMFEIVDGTIPEQWTVVGANGSFSLGPTPSLKPGFWEQYFDGEPDAVAVYKRELGLLDVRR